MSDLVGVRRAARWVARRSARWVLLGALGTLWLVGAGCSADRVVEVKEAELSTYFWRLSLDIRAATVAVGGTQQVVAVPLTVSGDTLAGIPAPVFTSQDPTKVTVDQAGVMTGVAETGGTAVIATVTAQGITHADTTMVAVTPESHTLASFAIESEAGDEQIARGDYRTLTVSAKDEHGVDLSGLSIAIETLTPATIDASGWELAFSATAVGTGRIVVQTTSYGVTMTDTMEYRIGYPMTGYVSAQAAYPDTTVTFEPRTVVIAVNGSVTWGNFANGPVNVTFEDGVENIDGGNIESLEPYDFENGTRQFTAAGTYHYKNALNGKTGQVVVLENP